MYTANIKLEKSIETNIVIDDHIFKSSNTMLESFSKDTHFVIITDQNIITHYNELILSMFQDYKYNVIVSIPGEKAKDISNIDKIYSELLDIGCDRGICLVAFGGGVIGDITGFIASTFMRGINEPLAET